MKRRLRLDVVVRQDATVLELLACEDKALLTIEGIERLVQEQEKEFSEAVVSSISKNKLSAK